MLHHKPRIEERTKVMVRARLFAGQGERDACILDISTRGLSATSASPPARGEFVELRIGKNNLVGLVKWSGERRFGIAFRERISVIAAISGEGDLVMQTRQRARRQGPDRRRAEVQPGRGRKLEFLVLAAAGVVAAIVLTGMVGSALDSLDTVGLALASSKVSG